MRIGQLHLIRYGKFTERRLTLPRREQDIHLIVGPNEAGKSTVRAAISDWLFGIPVRTSRAFLHPMPHLRLGGVMERRAPGAVGWEALAFDRIKGSKHTLRTPDDQRLPDELLQPWLGALTAQAFGQMYALDHQALLAGGAGILSASDDVGRMLFQSASGMEHFGAALQALQAQADALWAPRKSGSRVYYQALDAYEAAHQDFKHASLRTKEWVARHEALSATQTALEQARNRDHELRRQLSRLERIRGVAPLLVAWDAAQARHDALVAVGGPPLLDEQAGPVFRETTQAMVLAQAEIERLHQELEELGRARHDIRLDPTLLTWAADIHDLNERRAQCRAHRTELIKHTEALRQLWGQVRERAAALGWLHDAEDAVRQRLPAAPIRARLAACIAQCGPLEQDFKRAQGSLAACQQQLAQAEQVLAELGPGQADPALEAAVEQALRHGDQAAAIAAWQERSRLLGMQIEDGLAALGAWRRPLEALQTMVVPDAESLLSLLEQQREDSAVAKNLESALAAKTDDTAQRERALQQLVRRVQPVTREQVLQARRDRDAAWHTLKQAPQTWPLHAPVFEHAMRAADTLADVQWERADHEAERLAKAQALEQAQGEQHDLTQRLQAVRARMAARTAHWSALAATCGWPDLPWEAVNPWLAQRQAILAWRAEQAQLEQQISLAQDAVAAMRHVLWAQLEPGADPDAAPDWAACLSRARSRLDQAQQAAGQRQALTQQRRDAQRSLPALQAALEAARQAWQGWQTVWQELVQSAGYADTVSVDVLAAELPLMDELADLLERMRRLRTERIEVMQADLDGLAVSAQQLAQRVAPACAEGPPEEVALELARRLEAAKAAQSAAHTLQARLEHAQAALAQAHATQSGLVAKLAPWMAAAGVADVGALGPAIEHAERCRASDAERRAAEQRCLQAAEGLALPALRAQVAATDPDELKAELSRLGEAASAVVSEIAALSHQYGTQKAELDALQGTDAAARAAARRQEAIAAMADAAERYVHVQTAVRLMKWSIEQFRATQQGPMLAQASVLFKTLTRGSFSRLLVDTDEGTPRLLGVRPDGSGVEVTGMSEGSRDQLYLALRLAALALQTEQGLHMPLIADDVFINFDDGRTVAGLQALGELARQSQVICLTHHAHLVPLAQQALGADLHVVMLD